MSADFISPISAPLPALPPSPGRPANPAPRRGRAGIAEARPADEMTAVMADGTTDDTAPEAGRVSRRRFLRRWLGSTAALVGAGSYAWRVEPFWLDVHSVPMPLRNLPAAFAGFRIAHLTDLHAGDVPFDYLRHVIERVNALAPDAVVVTGDLVSDQFEWVVPISDLLARLRCPVYVSLGNHDYNLHHQRFAVPAGPGGAGRVETRLEEMLDRCLTARGVQVLRNRAVPLRRGGAAGTEPNAAGNRVWLVGLEDLWRGRFAPQVAFAGLDHSEPIIALSHNPDTGPALDAFGPQWILAGHTHGGQVRVPGYGALILNVQDRRFEQGLIPLPHGRMYVSRGVGFLKPIRLFCRPELPVFELRAI